MGRFVQYLQERDDLEEIMKKVVTLHKMTDRFHLWMETGDVVRVLLMESEHADLVKLFERVADDRLDEIVRGLIAEALQDAGSYRWDATRDARGDEFDLDLVNLVLLDASQQLASAVVNVIKDRQYGHRPGAQLHMLIDWAPDVWLSGALARTLERLIAQLEKDDATATG